MVGSLGPEQIYALIMS